MKSYNHLYDICLSEQNRRESLKTVKRSKRVREMMRSRNMSDSEIVNKSYDWIINFKNSNHNIINIYDGMNQKERKIIVPTLEELVVQHNIVNALKNIFCKGSYEHSYASLPGRGVHKGKRIIERWIKNDSRNCKYVLKLDIKHFFNSISHDILKEKLTNKIHDYKMLQLLFEIIDVSDEGLPLGFYTSQWLANWYLQDLDHYIKEILKAKHYIRYMDDMVIFGANKKKLHFMRQAIDSYLNNNLGLELKENWQVFRFSYGENKGRDLDFMGFRFYRNRTILRKKIMHRASRKAKKIFNKNKVTIYDARQMLSYLGWIDCTDTYFMYKKWIKPYVCFGMLKRKVSTFDRGSPINRYRAIINTYI